MAKKGRVGLSPSQKAEIWKQWRIGESQCEIGRLLGLNSSSVFNIVKKNGGIVPGKRKRALGALTLLEREEISRGIAEGLSYREIAAGLNRSPSTISREVGRNKGRESYRATEADRRAWDRGLRPKQCRLRQNTGLQEIVG